MLSLAAHPQKTENDSAMVRALVLFGFLLTAGFLALFVTVLLCKNFSLQSVTDAIALENGMHLNENDSVASINNTIVRSRELVFDSREALNACNGEHADLAPLADQLMQLSRSQAKSILQAKQKLVRKTINNLTRGAQGFDSANCRLIEQNEPYTRDLVVGFLNHQDSNVQAPFGNPSLFDFDNRNGFIRSSSQMYKACTELKLPGPDSDLDFSLSALPANEEPKRSDLQDFRPLTQLVKGGVATRAQCLEFPSALKLTRTVPVTIFGGLETFASVTSVASTHSSHQSSERN